MKNRPALRSAILPVYFVFVGLGLDGQNAFAAGDPVAAPSATRDAPSGGDMQGRVRSLESWRVAMQDTTAILETRYAGLSRLQTEIRNSLVAVVAEQAVLTTDWNKAQSRQQEVSTRIADVSNQVQLLAQAQQKTDAAVVRVEKQSTDRSGVVQLMNQVDALNLDVNRLRGQIEVLNNGMENAQKRQRDMYVDLDTRLRRMEGQVTTSKKEADVIAALEARIRQLEQNLSQGGAAAAAQGVAVAAPGANVPEMPASSSTPATESAAPAGSTTLPPATLSGVDQAAVQRSYDNALSNFRIGDYHAAIKGFDSLFKAHPKHSLAPNALYWIGECHFQLKDYRGAIDSHRRLLGAFPDSNKAPDAMLIIGTAETSLGDNAAAKKTLEELIARYPTSDSAEKAKGRLAKLK
ncbi:MAG: tol-pal system protein YbgF [Burkholderiales bacterium]